MAIDAQFVCFFWILPLLHNFFPSPFRPSADCNYFVANMNIFSGWECEKKTNKTAKYGYTNDFYLLENVRESHCVLSLSIMVFFSFSFYFEVIKSKQHSFSRSCIRWIHVKLFSIVTEFHTPLYFKEIIKTTNSFIFQFF